MAEPKTQATEQDPQDFLNAIEPDRKRNDGFALLAMFRQVTGEEPVMWGTSMVGFGRYHYKSEKSRQEGDWPLVAFSLRKQNLTLYIMHGNTDNQDLTKLGKHKAGMGCLYIGKLADVDLEVLAALIKTSFEYMKETNT